MRRRLRVAKCSATSNANNTTARKNFNETPSSPVLNRQHGQCIVPALPCPEALTQWKLMVFSPYALTGIGYAEETVVTQKELMIQPNAPRFVREKDSLLLSAKVVNMGDTLINGFVKLELINAVTGEPVDHLFRNAVPVKSFSVAPSQSTAVLFQLSVPENFNVPLLYRVSATSSSRANGVTLSDGEENTLPVLSNRMLVTETLPLALRDSKTKQFKFEPLLKSGSPTASSQQHYALTVEYTANPVWYAIQSLPYLTEYPYECSEQTFNRYYANIG